MSVIRASAGEFVPVEALIFFMESQRRGCLVCPFLKSLQPSFIYAIVVLQSEGNPPSFPFSIRRFAAISLRIKKLFSAPQVRSVMHIGLRSIKYWLTFAGKYTMIINRKRTFVRVGG